MKQPAPARNLRQLGELLRDQRHALGLSFDEICSALGRTKGSVSRWEQGKCRPRADLLCRWARILNLDIHQVYALAGYYALLELVEQETSLSSQPMALGSIKQVSETLADFAESDEAQALRVTWQEIRQLLAVPFTIDKSCISPEGWQELLLVLRRIEAKDRFGRDNEEQELVWTKWRLVCAEDQIIE